MKLAERESNYIRLLLRSIIIGEKRMKGSFFIFYNGFQTKKTNLTKFQIEVGLGFFRFETTAGGIFQKEQWPSGTISEIEIGIGTHKNKLCLSSFGTYFFEVKPCGKFCVSFIPKISIERSPL